LPRIQHYLGPLFKKSKYQPGGGALKITAEEKPVSLSALKQHGLTREYDKACAALLLFFSYHEAGKRGRGPYPAHYFGQGLTPELHAAIDPACDYLLKYGLLLVEKGMLSE
jgi:hypothetical protein